MTDPFVKQEDCDDDSRSATSTGLEGGSGLFASAVDSPLQDVGGNLDDKDTEAHIQCLLNSPTGSGDHDHSEDHHVERSERGQPKMGDEEDDEDEDRKPAARSNVGHDMFNPPLRLQESSSKRARLTHDGDDTEFPNGSPSAQQYPPYPAPQYHAPSPAYQSMFYNSHSPAELPRYLPVQSYASIPHPHAPQMQHESPQYNYYPPQGQQQPAINPYFMHSPPLQHPGGAGNVNAPHYEPYRSPMGQSRYQQASTSSAEHSSQFRRAPTEEELSECKTQRARTALQTWYHRLSQLYQYRLDNGDCNVPQKYQPNKELGVWVNKQRMEKKAYDDGIKSSMTQHKIDALRSIGFEWAKRKGETAWEEKYQELIEYKNEHGDCQVPTKYSKNPALGRWVSTQRSNYRLAEETGDRSKMTNERKRKLNDLGFVWSMMT